jgi:hypothetical protein
MAVCEKKFCKAFHVKITNDNNFINGCKHVRSNNAMKRIVFIL